MLPNARAHLYTQQYCISLPGSEATALLTVVTGLQAFREDRTLIAAADYIADALGQRFVESVPLNMERAWAESHPKCPLICLLSPGADPTKLIEVNNRSVSNNCCSHSTLQENLLDDSCEQLLLQAC